MAILKVKSNSIERNNFDYLQSYAETQSSNPTIVSELIQAYVLISQNLGVSPVDFLKILESTGDDIQQGLYLAQQMNLVRPRNAYLGVDVNQKTPIYVAREIAT